ncbi:MAG: glucose-6-phosphate isomerase [Deltaproteobacteria bacterium]|uniref:Glucose-6-phosphate isomerase n=1 Tax=Candidatus Zymogenus saltonus TaxID=2844893 RepID=A0A9D8KFS5_9DELT|nr:glucose-6-phosphate isomerase [Candidatus Zymogenus saltonus]
MKEGKKASFFTGDFQDELNRALHDMEREKVVSRIWGHDHMVWKPEPREITNRLGWLEIADAMMENVGEIVKFVEDVKSAGYTNALLMGMGGSSLAPEFFRKTFGVKKGFLDLAVLDSTDPGAVSGFADRLDIEKTLFIVSTKSGTTVETLSFFKCFYNLALKRLGAKRAGEGFIAITDPGSSLAEVAGMLNFRKAFLSDPNIGGRYSALSHFGLVPAALIGMDIETLLERAVEVASESRDSGPEGGESDAVRLGALMGALHGASVNKATFIISPEFASFGDWVEQLIAESTGKEGVGILPVVNEPLGDPSLYGDDRFFVKIGLEGDTAQDSFIADIEGAGRPVVRLSLSDLYDLGGQFFLWEMAVAVSGHLLKINPFEQPDVEAAKVLAKEAVARYKEEGRLPEETLTAAGDNITVYGGMTAADPGMAMISFLENVKPGGYVALMAYLKPEEEIGKNMSRFRQRIRERFGVATTFGYGPRFLHSTGQLHKGDSGGGIFIQFTADDELDVPIPDEAGGNESNITFGVLKAAQAMGDMNALTNAGRKVVRFHLGGNIKGGLELLLRAF